MKTLKMRGVFYITVMMMNKELLPQLEIELKTLISEANEKINKQLQLPQDFATKQYILKLQSEIKLWQIVAERNDIKIDTPNI